MSDLVVTVPKAIWSDWLDEGDLPGDPPRSGAFDAYDFTCAPVAHPKPQIEPGERVYVVSHGRLRGYAPLVEVKAVCGRWSLVRAGGAVAVTIPTPIRGFRGYLERWWRREDEIPFPRWKVAGVVAKCDYCFKVKPIVWRGDEVTVMCCRACIERDIADRRRAGIPDSPEDEAMFREAIRESRG